MNLYTIVLDYAGGTYVFQIEESSPYKAMIIWLKTMDLKCLKIGNVKREGILKQLYKCEEKPLPLSGRKSVWCSTFILNKKLALVNIIKTNKR